MHTFSFLIAGEIATVTAEIDLPALARHLAEIEQTDSAPGTAYMLGAESVTDTMGDFE